MAYDSFEVEVSTIGLDELGSYFAELLQGYEGKTEITGGLTITGHTYWVVLEYGSSPAEPDPGPGPDDPIILELPPASELPDLPPGSVYPESAHHAEWYPIVARHKRKLKFIDSYGIQRFTDAVHHPGVKAIGFIRRTIQQSLPDLFTMLDELDESLGDDIPDRKQVVQVFNDYLRLLLTAVRFATPVGAKENEEGFLKDAWGVQLAR